MTGTGVVRGVGAVALVAGMLVAGCEQGGGPGAGTGAGAEAVPGAFSAPSGCTHLATVQQRACSVVQVLSCGPDPSTRTLHRHVNGQPHSVAILTGGVMESALRESATGQTAGQQVQVSYVSTTSGTQLTSGDGTFDTNGQVADRGTGRTVAFRERWNVVPEASSLNGRSVIGMVRQRILAVGERRQLNVAQIVYDPDLGSVIGLREGLDVNPEAQARAVLNQLPVSVATPGQPGFATTIATEACAQAPNAAPGGGATPPAASG